MAISERFLITLLTLFIFFLTTGFLTSPAFIRYSIIALLVPAVFYSIKYCKKSFFQNKSFIVVVLLTLNGLISYLLNYDILFSQERSFVHLRSFFIGCFTGIPLLIWIPKTSLKLKSYLLSAFFAAVVISSINALRLYLGHGERTGGFIHIMAYGYGLALTLPVLIGIILNKKTIPEWVNYRLALIALPFGLLGLVLTQSRGAILGLVISLPLITRFAFPKMTKIYLVLLGIGGVFLSYNYFFGKNISHDNRLLMSYQNESDSIRRTLWTTAGIAVSEKPFFGWGPNNYRTQVSRIIDENGLSQSGKGFTHAHNTFLQIGSDLGLAGVILFIAWLLFWAFELIKSKNIFLMTSVLPVVAVIMVSGQFEYLNEETTGPIIFFIYALSQAILLSNKNLANSQA